MSSCRPWPLRPSSLVLLLAIGAASVQAQSGPAAASGEAGKSSLSDADRAKRDADKVFQWIKFHAEKSEPKKADKPEARPDPKPAARPAAMMPVARKTDSEATPPSATIAAAPIRSQSAAAPASEATRSAATPAIETMASSPVEVVAMAAPTAAPLPAVERQLPPPAPVALPEEEQSPLTLVKRVDPEYPRALLSQQRNGAVMVRFMVQSDGSVMDVEATRSPDRKLSAAAIQAVKQWRFAPISKPRPVSVEIGFQVD